MAEPANRAPREPAPGTPALPETALQRRRRVTAAALALAADQDGVVSRSQLRRLGIGRAGIRTETRAGRWTTYGRQTVAVHTSALGDRARFWSALWEVGGRAALDGVSALLVAGLEHYQEESVHVSVPRGLGRNHPVGVTVHESRLRTDADLLGAGIPRVRPGIAAVRAALWAVSDRQAALLIVIVVQQRMARPADLRRVIERVRGCARQAFIARVIEDAADGVQALGELDFARLCRERGLPEPSRQVIRKGRKGRVYLDVCWEDIGLVVEIDGVHHGPGLGQVDDALRQNTVTMGRSMALRVPLLGLRMEPVAFLDQIVRAHQQLTAAAA